MSMPKEPRAGAAALGGIALIAIGLWWFVQATGIIPAAVLETMSRSVGALAVIGLGVAVLLVGRRGTFAMPVPGTRLYRSRTDKVLGGVLGGLGAYLGIDPVILRIGTVLLTVLGAGALVVAYIVMWVLVPEEPLAPPAPVTPPVWPVTPDQPVTPEPPTPPAPPAPPIDPSADGS